MKLKNVLIVLAMAFVIVSPGAILSAWAEDGDADAKMEEWQPIQTKVIWPEKGMYEQDNASHLIDLVLQTFDIIEPLKIINYSNQIKLDAQEGLDITLKYNDEGLEYIIGSNWELESSPRHSIRRSSEISENSSMVAKVLIKSIILLDDLGIEYENIINMSIVEGKYPYVKFWNLLEDTPVKGANEVSFHFDGQTLELVGFIIYPWITLKSTVDHELVEARAEAVTFDEAINNLEEHPDQEAADLITSYAEIYTYIYTPAEDLDIWYLYTLINVNATWAFHTEVMIDGATGEAEVVNSMDREITGPNEIKADDESGIAIWILLGAMIFSCLTFLGGSFRHRKIK